MIVMAMVIAILVGSILVLTASDNETDEKLSSQVTEEELQAASGNSAEDAEDSSAVELSEEIQIEGHGQHIVKSLIEKGRLEEEE